MSSFILHELKTLADPAQALILQRFFKTGKGEYGEGDVFLGIRMPALRALSKQRETPPLTELQTLLDNRHHEARMLALLFLMRRYRASRDGAARKQVYDFYLANTARINNWDLVDITCRDIVGAYLLDKSRKPLYQLAKSKSLWEQRIAIISTWTFIKHHDFDDTLALSEKLLTHPHDLMHKAVGWMLREVGKKDTSVLCAFLDRHCSQMPRTALRYAIEHFSEKARKNYLTRSRLR
ncbi:MAG: DNA alkylation repair protein [Burkholderiales bacterium]|jgi:3-methyladenine DNA glycosylase AlkD|nr:DNA alkylation repair protein [Burkholderiales bacterium]